MSFRKCCTVARFPPAALPTKPPQAERSRQAGIYAARWPQENVMPWKITAYPPSPGDLLGVVEILREESLPPGEFGTQVFTERLLIRGYGRRDSERQNFMRERGRAWLSWNTWTGWTPAG